MTNTSLSISVKRSYSSTSSWLRLNDFDASEQYDSLDLSESSFSNDGNIIYDDALATFNEKALEAITQLKYIYEEILGIKLTI